MFILLRRKLCIFAMSAHLLALCLHWVAERLLAGPLMSPDLTQVFIPWIFDGFSGVCVFFFFLVSNCC